jgi:transposase
MVNTPLAHIGVGIDTARFGHRVSFFREDRQPAAPSMTVTENQDGYDQLQRQLRQLHQHHPQARFHVHLDAAGQYAANLERFLRGLDLPMTLSIGEPKRNRDYHKAFFPKQTTDNTESQAMARFGVMEQPTPSVEVPNEFIALREVAGRLEAQVKDTTRAVNRLHNLLARVFPELATLVRNLNCAWLLRLLKKYPTPKHLAQAHLNSLSKIPYLKTDLAEKIQSAARNSVGSFSGELAELLMAESVDQVQHCRQAEKCLENLLCRAYQVLPVTGHVHTDSIPGIGTMTAAVLVAKMISIDRFETPEHLVGYFGIFPEENTSGVDRSGQKIPPGTMRMSAKGSDLVRRYLWNAAKSAIQCNPAVRALYARLRARGTRGDVALGHCMRKLLHQVFGVWASNQPFDEARSQPRRTAPTEPSPGRPAAENGNVDSDPSPTKMAAGHKRNIPQRKVVTAATLSVAPPPAAVKQPRRQGSIDYAYVRRQITMEQVLVHLGYMDRLRGTGNERRGECPFHQATREGSQSFSVNLSKHVFRCRNPHCRVQGNALDLWAMAHQLPLYDAAQHLAATFKLNICIRTEKRPPVTRIHQRP